MKKTVGTLCVGEYLYSPTVDSIQQVKVDRIEKTDKGTRVDCGTWSTEIRKCDFKSDISTKVTYENRKYTYYVRLEDAQIKQKELQTIRLHELQKAAATAINHLTEFTNKYFTDETVH